MSINDRINTFFGAGGVRTSTTGRAASRPSMVKRLARLAATGAVIVPLAACGSDMGLKQVVGMAGGAALGGLGGAQIGSGKGQLAATAAGALLGAFIGGEIGRTMDEVDRMKAERAYQRAATAPVGETVSWENQRSGNRGTVTPTRQGRTADGRTCREYQTTVTIGGKTEKAHGVACRQPDGSWKIASAEELDAQFEDSRAPSFA